MTDTSDVQNDESTADDERLMDTLDQYVDALHADDVGSRTQSLQSNPELRGLMGCLDSLELLAPPHDMEVESRSPAFDKSRASASHFSPDAPTLSSGQHRGESHSTGSSIFQPALNEGERFGRYELVRELGRGGMGVVFLGRQTDLDREVAVKMILSSRLASPDDVRRFLAESKAAGRMRHPNIVGIHEAGEIFGQPYFTMDFVNGRQSVVVRFHFDSSLRAR